VSLGCVGVISDEAEYLSATTALATRDTFTADGKWMSGMVTNNGNRGLIYAGYVWGYATTVAAAYFGALMGWACPLATPTNFTLTFTAKHESLLSGDTTRWISAFICADDDTEYKDAPTDQVSGYHIVIRASGKMQIYKKAKGAALISLAETTSTAFTLGDFVTFTVVVTPTTVSVTRSDVAQTTTLTDSTYRGGYFHLGRNGCLAKFKDVIIT
jgi:glycerophosphoryl diester phosphodiesterase